MIVTNIIILLFCLLFGAFFSGTETGMISINRLRLRHLVRRKVKGAQTLNEFISKPDHLLGTTLVGTNLSYVIASITAARLGTYWLGAAGSWVSSVVLTLIVLLFCEYIPKAYFQSRPAKRTLPFAPLLQLAGWIFLPIGKLITITARLFVPAPKPEHMPTNSFISRDELLHLTRESVQSGVLSKAELQMIRGVFELTTTSCGAIMIPRNRMLYVNHDASADDMINLARTRSVNRFPVYNDEVKSFIGIIHIFDILADDNPEGKTAADYMHPPQFVPNYTPVDNVLPRMRVTRQPMMLVTNERLEVVGLLTLEDVLDEVVGEL